MCQLTGHSYDNGAVQHWERCHTPMNKPLPQHTPHLTALLSRPCEKPQGREPLQLWQNFNDTKLNSVGLIYDFIPLSCLISEMIDINGDQTEDIQYISIQHKRFMYIYICNHSFTDFYLHTSRQFLFPFRIWSNHLILNLLLLCFWTALLHLYALL